jgi:hypothetical protein
MKSLDINLPILLWAISWNVPELTSDFNVAAERTALMVSEELSMGMSFLKTIIPDRYHTPFSNNNSRSICPWSAA